MNQFLDKGKNPFGIVSFEDRQRAIRMAHETRVITLALIAAVVAAGFGVAGWCLSYQAGWV